MQRYLAEKYMSGPKADAILSRDATAKKKKRKQATSNIHPTGVDEDAGWGCPIKIDNDDENESRGRGWPVIGASERGGEDGGWISLPPEGQEQAQEVKRK